MNRDALLWGVVTTSGGPISWRDLTGDVSYGLASHLNLT